METVIESPDPIPAADAIAEHTPAHHERYPARDGGLYCVLGLTNKAFTFSCAIARANYFWKTLTPMPGVPYEYAELSLSLSLYELLLCSFHLASTDLKPGPSNWIPARAPSRMAELSNTTGSTMVIPLETGTEASGRFTDERDGLKCEHESLDRQTRSAQR